jgi:hypothetical protein
MAEVIGVECGPTGVPLEESIRVEFPKSHGRFKLALCNPAPEFGIMSTVGGINEEAIMVSGFLKAAFGDITVGKISSTFTVCPSSLSVAIHGSSTTVIG